MQSQQESMIEPIASGDVQAVEQQQLHVARLPAEQMALVLQNLPLQQRIGSCSLVCSSWEAAAALATPEVQLQGISNQDQADALCAWLVKHGSKALRHLSVKMSSAWTKDGSQVTVMLNVPWQHLVKLQSLQLRMVELPPLGGSSSSSGNPSSSSSSPVVEPGEQALVPCGAQASHIAPPAAAAANAPDFRALTALTRIQLTCYNIHSCAFAQQLQLLTGLRCLELQPLPSWDGQALQDDPGPAVFAEALTCALRRLVRLSCLSFTSTGVAGIALAAVSRLTDLQRLQLADEWYVNDSVDPLPDLQPPLQIQHLPSSLTALDLCHCRLSCSDSSGSQLRLLSELTVVDVDGFQPNVLRHMTHLMQVWIKGELSVRSFSRLLEALPHMQQLKSLEVQITFQQLVPQLPPAASYAAFTASSHLTALLLVDCCMRHDAARHMFTAGRQLPQLQQLEVGPSFDVLHQWAGMLHGVDKVQGCSLALSPGIATRLAACCRHLRRLSLLWATKEAAVSDLRPLLLLTDLTRLKVGGDGWDDAAAMAVLARLTGLQSLLLAASVRMTVRGAASLTSLTGLTKLAFLECYVSVALGQPCWGGRVVLRSAVQPSDVWQQLRQKCKQTLTGLAALTQHDRQEQQQQQSED